MPREKNGYHLLINKKKERVHNSKVPILRLFNDEKGIRGFLNEGVKRHFGYGNYIEFGINFKEKTLIVMESSRYINESFKISHPMRLPDAIVEELNRQMYIPPGESIIFGKFIDYDIVFDMKKVKRRIKGARENYGYY